VKGLFVAEIVRALQEAEVDLAVHSAKDLPAADDEGVAVAAVPPRADPSDLLVTRDLTLREGAIVGTSSLRRRAQLLALRPELRLVEIRGNVDRRLRKLEDGEVDGVVLAAAGIARLGATPPSSEVLPIVPAPGQGCLAVQARADDVATREAAGWLDDPDSRVAFEAERSVMARLGGGCALPLGALGTVAGDTVRLVAVVATPDGSRIVRAETEAATPEGAAEAASAELLAGGAGEILAHVRA
jgi:hydroxymethylbilane synthase